MNNDVDVTPKVIRVYGSTTRGNVFKLDKGRANYDLRKYYFTNSLTGWLTLVKNRGYCIGFSGWNGSGAISGSCRAGNGYSDRVSMVSPLLSITGLPTYSDY